MFHNSLSRKRVNRIGLISLDTLITAFFFDFFSIVKFLVCKRNMLCALEVNSDDGIKQEHIESCPSTTTNFLTSLALVPWSPNKARWWTSVRGWHPKSHITTYSSWSMWSREVTRLIKNIKSPLLKCLLSTNLSGWWHTAMSSHP